MNTSRRAFLKQVAVAGLAHTAISHGSLCAAPIPENAEADAVSGVASSEGGPAVDAKATDTARQAGESTSTWPNNPFLQGNFAPVQEEITADQLPVTGQLPADLRGMYVRNGPNPQFPPRGKYHWFDGDGMLHGVHLGDGRASYRNRWVRTKGFDAERAAGRALWGSLLELPRPEDFLQGAPFKNAANTALAWHDGRLLALWEGGPPHEIVVPELSTAGLYTYDERLRHSFTAHPKIDPLTGEMMFFGYSVMAPYLQYSVVGADGRIVRTTPIELPRPVMMHDFAVTERYSIFMDLPETFDLVAAAGGAPPFRFAPELGARFGILPRHGEGSQVRWFAAEPCFVFHTLNAYEDGDQVVLIGCRMERFPELLAADTADTAAAWNAAMLNSPRPYRWRFDLATGETHEEPLDDLAVDFPRVPDARLGRPMRYGYYMSIDQDALVKFDHQRGTHELHRHGPGRSGGEGVFVPRPDGQHEDDGWLITFVYDQALDRSELVVVDARDMSAPPLARVHLPQRVPHGFHGLWLDEALWTPRA